MKGCEVKNDNKDGFENFLESVKNSVLLENEFSYCNLFRTKINGDKSASKLPKIKLPENQNSENPQPENQEPEDQKSEDQKS
jgi:hypothetical protein